MKVLEVMSCIAEMSKRNSSAVARLKQDYIRLKKDPVSYPSFPPSPIPPSSPHQGCIMHTKIAEQQKPAKQ